MKNAKNPIYNAIIVLISEQSKRELIPACDPFTYVRFFAPN